MCKVSSAGALPVTFLTLVKFVSLNSRKLRVSTFVSSKGTIEFSATAKRTVLSVLNWER